MPRYLEGFHGQKGRNEILLLLILVLFLFSSNPSQTYFFIFWLLSTMKENSQILWGYGKGQGKQNWTLQQINWLWGSSAIIPQIPGMGSAALSLLSLIRSSEPNPVTLGNQSFF